MPQEKGKKSFPKLSEESGITIPSFMTPESLCQTAPDSPDVVTVMSSESTPSSPGSGSPQLDQLLSDLEEMKLKFKPEALDPHLSKSNDDRPEVRQISEFKEILPQDQCPAEYSDTVKDGVSSVVQLAVDKPDEAVTEPADFQTSIQVDEVVSVNTDIAKTGTSVLSSCSRHKDSPVSSTDSSSSPESPQRLCEEMEALLDPSFHVDALQLSKHALNGSQKSVDAKSQSEIPEKNLWEDSTADTLHSKGHESVTASNDSKVETEGSQSIQDQLYSWPSTSDETTHNEDLSSQSLSDLTPETVISARHFSFEELMPYPSSGDLKTSSDDDRPKTSGQHSEGSLTPVDDECFNSQSSLIKPKTETSSSSSDEEHSFPPGYAEASSITASYTQIPPGYTHIVHSGTDSPTFEYSDPEAYFDCKQVASDFSETDPDEPGTRARSSGGQTWDNFSHPRVLGEINQKVLSSSGSEDYEDAPFVHEPLYHVHVEKEEIQESSDEEFSLCEASQPPPFCETGSYDDTDKSLTREIIAELGSMSESSDDDFLTTRIVRRRVVIQADEMPDLPAQSVSEEKYTDKNGHIVVKRVTRKIIHKCASVDGVEHEEMSLEGAPQGSIPAAEGDGYSKVVKRTVLKSEGDHTEVTFTECEGSSPSRQDTGDDCKVSHIERTTVVEGERTMTQQGDQSLASDLPTAQDDFKKALGYLSGFSGTQLPQVVESETVKEDGTVVRRAHMRKGRTFTQTVVMGAGQRKHVLERQVDYSRKGSKTSDLQQHLHQLFHHYCKEKEDNDEDEEVEEE